MENKKDDCRCVICDTVGNWENVDEYRVKKEGMHVCKSCGFVAYPQKYMNEDEAKKYYEHDYRKPPAIGNLYTGQRKLNMHSHFLGETLEKWQKDKKETPVVADIGAAYGMFLNWVRSYFPKGEYLGTEFAESYRRNAFHEYNLNLGKDFDQTKKYDLITTYKVAEHQLDVDLRLREYVECLKEDGLIYVSVPTWFNKMTNFGLDGFDLEYYYHPDHINVWTQKLFETLLKKVGLEVVKFDGIMYDESYLCKRNDSLMDEPRVYEDYKEIIERMKNIKLASDLYQKRDFDGALKAFPNYFEAWNAKLEIGRADSHKDGQMQDPLEYVLETFVNPCLEACGRSLNALRLATDVHMRYGKYKAATTYIDEALELRPNQATFLMALSHCYRQLSLQESNQDEKIRLLKEARDVCKYIREVDEQSTVEATNWIYQDNASLPVETNI